MSDTFAQFMGQAKNAAADFTKLFADLKMPATVDVETLLSAHRKNLEVLSAANKVALEGAQAVAKRHTEILQQTATELTETLRALTSAETPQAKAAKQAELLKSAYEKAVSNTKELGDLIQRSNGEALALLNARFTEALDEIKTLIEKAQTAA